MTIPKNNRFKGRKGKAPYTTQTSATGKGAKPEETTPERNAERIKNLASWNPSQAKKFKESLQKEKPVVQRFQPTDEVGEVNTVSAEDSAVPVEGYDDGEQNSRTLVNHGSNMDEALRGGHYAKLIAEHGATGLPSMASIERSLKKSRVSTTDLLLLLKKKPPIANRKFKGNFAGQTPDWSQKTPTQERDVDSWAEERTRRGENKEAGLPNGLDGSLKANKNTIKGAPKLQGLRKEGNGTGEGAGAGVATGSGGLAGGGTAHVSTNSGIFTTTYGGDRGKKKKSDNDIATMTFNKRGAMVAALSEYVQKLDKGMAPEYNRNVKMRQAGGMQEPDDQKTEKPVERQVSHKGNKRANTWKNP